MIRTLITGGTGFVGAAIAQELVKSSESVAVLSRNWKTLPREKRISGVHYIQGSIFHEAELLRAMEGCDALIIAVQFDNAPFENPRKGQTYERVDGEGTRLQIEAAKKSGIKRIIYMSGAGTREGRKESWFQAKWKAETAVRESGKDWTIFRPSWIYGPQDRSLNRFSLFARLGPVVPLIGTGREKIQPVFVQDVAKAVRLSLQNEKTYGKIFEIGGPETLTMREIVQTMLSVQKKKRILLPHPKPIMKILASLISLLPDPVRFLTADGVDFVTMEESVDNAELLRTLGLELTPLRKGLESYMAKRRYERGMIPQRTAAMRI